MSPLDTHNIIGSEAFSRRQLSPAVGAMTITRRRGAGLIARALHTALSGAAMLAFIVLVIVVAALLERAQ